MSTTYEPHDAYCLRCYTSLGLCPPETGCTNRYTHAGGVCDRCRAIEMTEQGEE